MFWIKSNLEWQQGILPLQGKAQQGKARHNKARLGTTTSRQEEKSKRVRASGREPWEESKRKSTKTKARTRTSKTKLTLLFLEGAWWKQRCIHRAPTLYKSKETTKFNCVLCLCRWLFVSYLLSFVSVFLRVVFLHLFMSCIEIVLSSTGTLTYIYAAIEKSNQNIGVVHEIYF